MSSVAIITTGEPVAGVEERVRPLLRVEYDRLVELGCFQDDRIELLNGQLVEVMPQRAPHAGTVEQITAILAPLLSGRARLRIQAPFAATDDSEPEPDLAVVAPVEHVTEHPRTAFLVIEVADTSLRRDLERKPAIYAAAGVEDYWVVDLVNRVVVVHREPMSNRYCRITTHRGDEFVTVLAFSNLKVRVSDLLPRGL